MRTITIVLLVGLLVASTGIALSQTVGSVDVTEGDGTYLVDGEDQGIEVVRGAEIQINVDTPGETFYISTANRSNLGDPVEPYRAGVQISGDVSQEVLGTDTGNISFTPPADAPDTLYFHSLESTGYGAQIVVRSGNASTTESALPTVFGAVAGVPFWMFGLLTVLVGVVGFLIGREVGEDPVQYV